ncbi:DnaD domain protein [Paenibacillus senegalensis]|uniref:DnaD domain protein n=1 Tax=Paenibacillus senegalensis TaxID=1465766 RepID=UPI0004745AEF|nr:DnaD domain protein [Paenibacillus senegalensis]
MRITNQLHFTENHRYCVYRDFALSSLDYRLLGSLYQPMIGAMAVGIYYSLYQQLPGDRIGFSALEQQRRLFLSLDLEPGEKGRSFFIEQSSKLEAVGLMQTSRRYLSSSEDYVYDYQLFRPLSPEEFFKNQHLTLLLRDKVGKYMVLSLKEELMSEEPAELTGSQRENLSVPFYDLFRLNTQVVDYELEQAIYQTASDRQTGGGPDVISKGFDYADIIRRFPRESVNRSYVEALKYRLDQLAVINITAKKYQLTLLETCRLLDEDEVFDEEGHLQEDVLKYKANLYFRQSKRRTEQHARHLADRQANQQDEPAVEQPVEMNYYVEVPPLFQGQCDIHQYNMILRNEPYTLVLQRFFSQGSVPDGVLDIFQKIDLNYKLKEEVINVLIHYIHVDRRSWAKSSIEAVASDLLGKQIHTYEQAVEYIREKMNYKQQAERRRGTKRASSPGWKNSKLKGKPEIPVITDKPAAKKLSQAELEAIRQKAMKLDGKL